MKVKSVYGMKICNFDKIGNMELDNLNDFEFKKKSIIFYMFASSLIGIG